MRKVFWVTYPKTYLIAFLVFAATLCFGASSGQAKEVKSDDLGAKLDKVLQKLDAVSCAASGFIDNLDGTVCDCVRDLMWEKKTGTVDAAVKCVSTATCPDPHDVNNRYSWTDTGDGDLTNEDGTVFTVFLEQLNDVAGGGANCFAGHCDWRLPEARNDAAEKELVTILDLSQGFCGGGIGACINPIFGPTAASFYWSAITFANDPDFAWVVFFGNGGVSFDFKGFNHRGRAVRTGP